MAEIDWIQGIINGLNFVKNIAVEQVNKCAGPMRTILECAVKLFWLKKFGEQPAWIKGTIETLDLYTATTDTHFTQHFSKIIVGDINLIRTTCNEIIHGGKPLTLNEAKELLNRLEKCIKAIEEAIPMKIISPPPVQDPITTKPLPVDPIPTIDKILRRDLDRVYGTRAQGIYDECCDKFGWDRSKRYLFGMQQILYAKEATPEKYSPWFLVHSNLSETKPNGNWSNRINQDDTIEELWEKPQDEFYHDETIRVTFAKKKKKGYVFLGLYKPIRVDEKKSSNGNKIWIKTYQLISDTYPRSK